MAGDAGGHRGGLAGLVAGLALSVWAGGPQAGAGASRPRGALPPAVARYLARWEAPPATAHRAGPVRSSSHKPAAECACYGLSPVCCICAARGAPGKRGPT